MPLPANISSLSTLVQSPADSNARVPNLGIQTKRQAKSDGVTSQPARAEIDTLMSHIGSSTDPLPSLSGQALVTDSQLRAENAALRSQVESLRACLPSMLPRPSVSLTSASTASTTSPYLRLEMAALRSEIELLRTSLAVPPPGENAPPPYNA